MPIQTEGELFIKVQEERVFSDSKTFPDSRAKAPPAEILRRYHEEKDRPAFDLARFVDRYFELPPTMEEHIDRLWPTLVYEPHHDDGVEPSSPEDPGTLIPLPYPYVVPGGRFSELYYWDSYFTALGLAASRRLDLVESTIRNFAFLIDRYGFIPNANRVYYLSRSQPPFFCCLLQLLEQERGTEATAPYWPQLEREYRYWVPEGIRGRGPGAYGKAVILEDGACLSRYRDVSDEPRPEGYREDRQVHSRASENRRQGLYRQIRSAAESGWDFSSRWLGNDRKMTGIRTTALAPVDLNCLIYNMEAQLSVWLAASEPVKARAYAAAAGRRKDSILRTFWNEKEGWFFDLAWRRGELSEVWSLAGVYPLFFQLADRAQAACVAGHVERDFLQAGGVVTTLHRAVDPQCQWDFPNGWAPLQWMTVGGLRRYGYDDLAETIARRFVRLADRIYRREGKMLERYNVCEPGREAFGGEYPLQDGFGWTNGVVKALLSDAARHP